MQRAPRDPTPDQRASPRSGGAQWRDPGGLKVDVFPPPHPKKRNGHPIRRVGVALVSGLVFGGLPCRLPFWSSFNIGFLSMFAFGSFKAIQQSDSVIRYSWRLPELAREPLRFGRQVTRSLPSEQIRRLAAPSCSERCISVLDTCPAGGRPGISQAKQKYNLGDPSNEF